jgi:hypothetical protein
VAFANWVLAFPSDTQTKQENTIMNRKRLCCCWAASQRRVKKYSCAAWELRKRDYLPILFDFDIPANRDITETVSLLARMARFIVADLTDREGRRH